MNTPMLTDLCGSPRARLILAHGAGAPMDSAFMNHIAQGCCQLGIEVVRFEFPYMAARREGGGKRPPNKQPQLLATWQEMIDRYCDDPLPLFIGGKSMGGRMATLCAVANASSACRGIVCLGYPFHPPGRPTQLRVEHLRHLRVPALIVQGTRDQLGSQEEVKAYDLGERVQCHWIDTGNHDLMPLKRSGLTYDQAMTTAIQAVTDFIAFMLGANSAEQGHYGHAR